MFLHRFYWFSPLVEKHELVTPRTLFRLDTLPQSWCDKYKHPKCHKSDKTNQNSYTDSDLTLIRNNSSKNINRSTLERLGHITDIYNERRNT